MMIAEILTYYKIYEDFPLTPWLPDKSEFLLLFILFYFIYKEFNLY